MIETNWQDAFESWQKGKRVEYRNSDNPEWRELKGDECLMDLIGCSPTSFRREE